MLDKSTLYLCVLRIFSFESQSLNTIRQFELLYAVVLRVLWRDDMVFPLSYRKETCEKGRCSAVVVTAGWSFKGLTIGGLHDAGVCVSTWKPSHWCHLRTLRMHRALRQAVTSGGALWLSVMRCQRSKVSGGQSIIMHGGLFCDQAIRNYTIDHMFKKLHSICQP